MWNTCLVGVVVNVLVDDLEAFSSNPDLYQFLSGSGSGLGRLVQFLSGNPPLGSGQNGPNSIRTVLWVFKKFWEFLSGSGSGFWGHFRGSCRGVARSPKLLLVASQHIYIEVTRQRLIIRLQRQPAPLSYSKLGWLPEPLARPTLLLRDRHIKHGTRLLEILRLRLTGRSSSSTGGLVWAMITFCTPLAAFNHFDPLMQNMQTEYAALWKARWILLLAIYTLRTTYKQYLHLSTYEIHPDNCVGPALWYFDGSVCGYFDLSQSLALVKSTENTLGITWVECSQDNHWYWKLFDISPTETGASNNFPLIESGRMDFELFRGTGSLNFHAAMLNRAYQQRHTPQIGTTTHCISKRHIGWINDIFECSVSLIHV